MNAVQAIVLGVVQGVTEFLPISSDGHLALIYAFFDLSPDLTYMVFLHGATLLAMYAYFWRDITALLTCLLPSQKARAAERRVVVLIVVGTLVSGVVAKLIEPVVEPMAANLAWVAVWFAATALMLCLGEIVGARLDDRPTEALGWPGTGFVGVMQGLAVLPGLSRSGSTISAGMMAGLSRESAARFSFLLGIPIITLAFALDGIDVLSGGASLPDPLASAAGFVAAGVSGYLAIGGLLRFVKGHKLYPFAVYTGVLAAILSVTVLVGKG